jgi:transcriptional regulator of met regulon
LYCSACEKSVSIEQRFLVVQHIGTAKHKESKIRRQKFKQQFFTSASTSSGNKNSFNSELCRAFIHADIQISKLENKSLNAFLTKYTGQLIPDESTLSKNNMQKFIRKHLILLETSFKMALYGFRSTKQ